MNAKPNQRHYFRRPALFNAKYTVESGRYRDLIKNVSAGGIYICTRQTINHGQRISLRFPIFAFDRRPSIMGTVVRSEDGGVAVMFDNPIEERIGHDDRFPHAEKCPTAL